MASRNIRFLKNIVLKVNCEGEIIDVPFAIGDTYEAKKIQQDSDGFNDILLAEGSIVLGIHSSLFENLSNRVPVVQVEMVEAIEAQEIEVAERQEGPALLDGTMVSNSDEE